MAIQYMQYVAQHGKSYITEEEFSIRKAMYIQTDAIIEAHNETESSFKLGHNKFSDFTDAERTQLTGALKYNHVASGEQPLPNGGLPTNWDWRDQGAVSPIKDQGQCGSCWAFSAVGALEGANKIKNGNLTFFSEQQQVDCNSNCYGCGGGWSYKAFDYWQTNAAETEDAYPYTAKDGTCVFDASQATDVTT